MKTVLVTGGAGFLGSHLCKKLIDCNYKVLCVDNNYTGSLKNLESVINHHNFNFIEHDIINPLTVNEKIDEIYNLATPASPVHYQGKAALFTIKTCVHGSINMLELAKKHRAKILQTSTSEIYGEPLEQPQKENYRGNVNPIGIRACYDEGKRLAETLFFEYHRQESIKIKVVRIFNTYGPYMNPEDGRVVSNFICQALRGDAITIYGDGSQTRSFCYADDMIEAVFRMMNSPDNFTGPVNIGNPHEFTVKELAEKVLKLTGGKSAVIYMPLPLDDPSRRRPDITLAKNVLGWEPSVQLEEGLMRTVEYFKRVLKA
ncbi:MAG: SDR family oxidoreductase [Deferribacteraceae bacterium]|jgi:UDP-glucuronate decarboxylase|nr:SDR family oxidoreductase [Deferribacteraceae bacterium]